MTTMAKQITQKLTMAFSPTTIHVIDQSHLHAGHAGARKGGESHFALQITAAAFSGLTLLARHRAINQVLAEELAGQVHALTIQAEGL